MKKSGKKYVKIKWEIITKHKRIINEIITQNLWIVICNCENVKCYVSHCFGTIEAKHTKKKYRKKNVEKKTLKLKYNSVVANSITIILKWSEADRTLKQIGSLAWDGSLSSQPIHYELDAIAQKSKEPQLDTLK